MREIIGLTEKKMDSYLVAGRLGYCVTSSLMLVGDEGLN